MSVEITQTGIAARVLEPPRRVLDATTPFFHDYGYSSPDRAIRAISESLDKNRFPHLILIVGEPKNGKQHELLDINNRLHQGKRSEGILSKIEREQGYPAPVDVVYWGNSYSVAKIKGRIPEDKIYGQVGDEEMNVIVAEYGELISKIVKERQGQAAVIFAKAVLMSGIRIDGKLYGRNRGLPVFEEIIFKQRSFKDLHYKTYIFGVVADPAAVAHGNESRTKSEGVIDNPEALVKIQRDDGEIILTEQGEQAELTKEQQQAFVEYISEGANDAASKEIIGYTNNLAIKLSEMGRLKLNGESYCFNPNGYFLDRESNVWRFYDPGKRRLAVALLMRYIFEENLGLTNRMSLFGTQQLEERIFDLRYPPHNVAKAYYPDIQNIRNK